MKPGIARWMMCVAAGLVLGLAACESDDGQDAAYGPPDFQGILTAVSEGSIRIEENPAEEWGGSKAALQITDSTSIVWSNGAAAVRADLRTGQRVQAWVRGPVMESYPVQGTAQRVRIEASGL